MQTKEKNLIVELTFNLALEIIKYAEDPEKERKYIIEKQLLRSGTSIGANVREAQNAESKADFIHKMKIAAKETDETIYWLLLCEKAENYPAFNSLVEDAESILRVLSKIIASSKNTIRNFDK